MPDETRVPTEKDIAELPRWAQVAFAIRCAKRVQPLFRATYPDVLAKYGAAVDQAIQMAERLLRGDKADAAWAVWAATAAMAAKAADMAAFMAVFPAKAATAAGKAWVTMLLATRRDFKTLNAMSKNQHWTDETRPTLESLGPIWLEGEEPAWKEFLFQAKGQRAEPEAASDQLERLVLTAYVDESVDDDTLVEGIVELYRALNRYHIACGGSGLTIDDWRILVRAGVPGGVPA